MKPKIDKIEVNRTLGVAEVQFQVFPQQFENSQDMLILTGAKDRGEGSSWQESWSEADVCGRDSSSC